MYFIIYKQHEFNNSEIFQWANMHVTTQVLNTLTHINQLI